MIEGMWAVYFGAEAGGGHRIGAGVVTLESERVFGGDSNYYYTGSYAVKDSRVTAEIRVRHYFGDRNNVFGPVEEIILQVTGVLIDRQQAIMAGHIVGQPGREIAMGFQRLADLP
ncbi:MAG TPA: GrlR family regulatory protein [Nevskia sp.]|nr:GrlR family regulatory protein [Nevskia sp.]